MKVLLSWLREFAPLEGTPEQIADQLTALGMELDSVSTIGEGLDGIVVAEVLDIRPHPDADRIRLVDVDAGDGQPLQIACGASNMSVGDRVPLATIGTVMPNGMEIARRKMRGEMSNGMLCSAAELELGDDQSGILILDSDTELGTPITDALSIGSDIVYEFDALPNRPDTLSILGVARDLAAHQKVPFSIPAAGIAASTETGGSPAAELCSVEIADPQLCGRFELRVLSDVPLGASPRWMAQRLLAVGMRPINYVVDVTNYVMLEMGHPSHAFDLATLPGGELRVRRAERGETLTTLDGIERTLDPGDGVITDGGGRPVALAGVMGGAETEISASTTHVALELAWWDPFSVAATSTRLNLHSDAALRYKRGVDPQIAPLAADRICQLLRDGGADLHPGSVVAHGNLPEPARIEVRPERINALLGTELSAPRMVELLEPIGFTSQQAGDALEVRVPTWRPDSTIEADIAEEVARHFGYSSIERTVPVSPHTGELTPGQLERRTLRRTLVGAGLTEAMPLPFLAPGDLERCGLPADGLVLANPLAAEESVLRTSLLPGLVDAVAYNARHRNPGVGLFEMGRVFGLGERGVITDVEESWRAGRVLDGEVEHLAAVLAGHEAPDAVRLLERLLRATNRWPDNDSEVLEPDEIPGLHPGRGAWVALGGQRVGSVGEIDPDVLAAHGIEERVAWLQLDVSQLCSTPAPVPVAAPVSRYPSSDIDLAFVVDESVPAAALRWTLATAVDAASGESDLPVRVELFDVFRSQGLGEGRKSLAFRLRFQARDRTLTDEAVAELRSVAIGAAEREHDAVLRA